MSDKPLLLVYLLPGLDGSGNFFEPILSYFEAFGEIAVLAYPKTGPQDYFALANFVENEIDNSVPFVVVAESFAGPLAIELAARNPLNLKGVLLVATFFQEPLGRPSKSIARFVSKFRYLPVPPESFIKWLLLGTDPHYIVGQLKKFLDKSEKPVLIERAVAALSCDYQKQLSQIRVPVVSFVAKQDRLILYGINTWKSEGNIEVREIDGPHFLLQCGNKQQVTSCISSFFEKCV